MSDVRRKEITGQRDVVLKPVVYPFAELIKSRQVVASDDGAFVVGRSLFFEIMNPVLRKIRFDENFYRSRYKDIADAEEKGAIKSLHDHYLRFGYFENRLPCKVDVDSRFYAREYPDVAIAILENRIESAQLHFEVSGFVEGRLPRKGWSFAELIEG